jgi:hypothetical protein
MTPLYDLIVVGAGAAGLFAAARTGGQTVLVLERGTRPGRKVALSGKGQCNYTHAENLSEMVRHYGDKKNFVKHALGKLGADNLIQYFETLGVPSVVQENGKVFPATYVAGDLIEALMIEARSRGVHFEFNRKVERILPLDGGGFEVACGEVSYESQSVMITCGGSSYPMTGSDGAGLALAASLGLEVVPPRPGLVPIYHSDALLHNLAGVSIKSAKFKYHFENETRNFQGDLLMTHTGLSGPGILDASRWMQPSGWLELNFSGMDTASFEAALLEAAKSQGNKQLKTILRTLIPTRALSEVVEKRLGEASANLEAASMTREMRQKAAKLSTAYTVVITALGELRTAMVTAGGVSTHEVVGRTLMAKRMPGLHLAGEVLDVDGDTGGYNIHWAFASGLLAAESALSAAPKSSDPA